MIAPSTAFTFLVMMLPYSSDTTRSDHVRSYVPGLQVLGTSYVRVITYEPFAALTFDPFSSPKANSCESSFFSIVDLYATEPETDL